MGDTLKIFLMFLFFSIEAGAVFIFVALSTRHPTPKAEEEAHHLVGYAVRGVWFAFLTLLMLAAFAATASVFPYLPSRQAAQGAALRVPVIAGQYSYEMPSHLPLNRRIIFEVTSRDVNHSFAIYGPGGDVMAQTQAMPNYVNDLGVTFREPGQYTVRCLEYCGLGHPMMEKQFTVGGTE